MVGSCDMCRGRASEGSSQWRDLTAVPFAVCLQFALVVKSGRSKGSEGKEEKEWGRHMCVFLFIFSLYVGRMVTLPSPLQGKGKETAEDSMWYSWEGEIIETTELCDIKKKKKNFCREQKWSCLLFIPFSPFCKELSRIRHSRLYVATWSMIPGS